MNIRTIPRIVGYVVLWALLFVLASVSIVPKLMGGTGLTILTGSMEPKIHPGDVVVIKPVDFKDLNVGDIITFQPKSGDPMLITHRIVAKSSGGVNRITTRGDANGASDNPIKPEQIKGKFQYRVPWVGHVINPVKNTLGNNGSLVAGALIALGVFWMLMPDKGDKKSERDGENDTDGAQS